jgi:hypothetical protein
MRFLTFYSTVLNVCTTACTLKSFSLAGAMCLWIWFGSKTDIELYSLDLYVFVRRRGVFFTWDFH